MVSLVRSAFVSRCRKQRLMFFLRKLDSYWRQQNKSKQGCFSSIARSLLFAFNRRIFWWQKPVQLNDRRAKSRWFLPSVEEKMFMIEIKRNLNQIKGREEKEKKVLLASFSSQWWSSMKWRKTCVSDSVRLFFRQIFTSGVSPEAPFFTALRQNSYAYRRPWFSFKPTALNCREITVAVAEYKVTKTSTRCHELNLRSPALAEISSRVM